MIRTFLPYSRFICDTNNIPDHNNRPFVRRTNRITMKGPRAPPKCTKKAASGRPPGHGKRKTDPRLNKSVLPFYHTMPAWTTQAGKGSSQ